METIASTPGIAAAIIRYLGSIARLKKDDDWIQNLLADAENERLHL
jgi:ubiquinol oxidase